MGKRREREQKEENRSRKEYKLPNGTKIRDLETNRILTIISAIETNNTFGYGIYLYYVKEIDGIGLYRNEFEMLGKKKGR